MADDNPPLIIQEIKANSLPILARVCQYLGLVSFGVALGIVATGTFTIAVCNQAGAPIPLGGPSICYDVVPQYRFLEIGIGGASMILLIAGAVLDSRVEPEVVTDD